MRWKVQKQIFFTCFAFMKRSFKQSEWGKCVGLWGYNKKVPTVVRVFKLVSFSSSLFLHISIGSICLGVLGLGLEYMHPRGKYVRICTEISLTPALQILSSMKHIQKVLNVNHKHVEMETQLFYYTYLSRMIL